MASYTDAITQFNPYVQQLPVELMMQVGMQKQAQYDAGVQKIQQSIDNVAGLEIDKEAHRKYLNSKLGELGNKLRMVAGGDFSNQQLVNSVSGMSGSLIKDPIIRNAVYSTQKLRKGTAEMEAARKKGTLTPQNKYMFDLQANAYLNDPDLETQFNGSYEDFFDQNKFASEMFSKVTKGKIKWEDLYERNPDGSPKMKYNRDKKGNIISSELVISPTMKTHIQEGILPDVVKKTIDQIMSDPRVARQLEIDGQYMYRGLDGQNLHDMALAQKEYLLDKANDKLLQLNIDMKTGKDVQGEMDMLKADIKNIVTKYDDIAQAALKNPDAVKGKLNKDSFIDNTTSMYGTMTHEIDTDENPLWRANFDMTKEANDIAMETRKLNQAWTISQNEIASREKIAKQGFTNAVTIANIRASKGAGEMMDSDGDGVPDTFIPGAGVGGGAGINPELDENDSNIGTYMARNRAEKATAAATLSDVQNNMIWDMSLSTLPQNVKILNNYMSAGVSKQEAIAKIIETVGKKDKAGVDGFITRMVGSVMTKINKMSPAELAKNPALLDTKNKYEKARNVFADVNEFSKTLEKDVEKAVGKEAYEKAALKNIKPIEGSYQGKRFKLGAEDQLDLALYIKGYQSVVMSTSGIIDKGVRGAADAAAQRLSAKGLGFMLDYALQRSDTSQGYWTEALDQVTPAVRFLQRRASNVRSGFSRLTTGKWGNPDVDLDPIMKLTKNLDTEVYSKVFGQTEKLLKQHYNISPNVKLGMLSGDTETDKRTMMTLRRLASSATEAGKNLSPDLDGFAKALDDEDFGLKKGSIEAKVINGEGGNPMVEIVAGTPSGGREGGMIVTMDVAKNLGLNIEGIFEPTEIRLLKNIISQRGGQTSIGNPSDKNTYKNNDVRFTMNDFPQLAQYSDVVDVRANIIQRNGKYYGVIYAKDNRGRDVLRETPGHESLQRAQQTLLSMNINNINMLLNE